MQTMGILDWTVIGTYAVGMIAIGVYYSFKTKTSEDFMLGGRHMNPFAVGLSLFATMLSAISYLSWPGELIKYGPMMFCGIAAYPFCYFVNGWILIPRIMKLKVTSAHELLEIKLGLSVRILASLFFLTMRIVWMSVIIYMSAEKVIIPIMKWPPEYIIRVSVVLGVITMIYTSLGGLRAVVATDVIQSIILFGGGILSIIIIMVKMGGVGAWWPQEWFSGWAELKFNYDPKARVTFVGAFISVFCWYVYTAGSDQMAIQRYFSTRDAKSARRVELTSLVSNGLVTILLGILGLALLGYFQANQNLIPADWTLTGQADKLFPHFIVIALPPGVTGLVVAGLLAAAMSSLSSGLNSSSLVITNDFLGRFRKREVSESYNLMLARIVSFAIGTLIILLSTLIDRVSGNLLEVTYKTTNLLVAPLFVPFFMALFVPRAKAFGTFCGMLVSIITAVLIAFWKELTGHDGISFLWILPLAFIAGAAVSYVLSFLPTGQKSNVVE